MRLRLVPMALVLCAGVVTATGAAAQVAPLRLLVPIGQSADSNARSRAVGVLRLGQTALRHYSVTRAGAGVECPMPVAVPDSAKSERMPTARVNSAPYAIRQVPLGCVNPLGPRPDTSAVRQPSRH